MSLTFEWYQNKSEKNERKHDIMFEEAKVVFNDPFAITIDDPDYLYGEYRFIDIGFSSKGGVLVVWYTERNENIRIIGCRKATRSERKKYEEKMPNFSNSDMRDEYNFSGGVRGKHYKDYRKGHTVIVHKDDGSASVQYFTQEDGSVMLDPDVKVHFPDSESVNKALRSLIA